MTLGTKASYSLLRLGIFLVGSLLLFHFYIHPWLAGQLASATSQLPVGTVGLLSNPGQAIQQVVGHISPTLP